MPAHQKPRAKNTRAKNAQCAHSANARTGNARARNMCAGKECAAKRARLKRARTNNHARKNARVPKPGNGDFQPKERTTRKHDFQLHHFKANDGIQGVQSNSFYHRSVKAWNNLRKSVVNAKDVNTFKNRLDEIWKNDQIMFDHVPPITSD